MNFYQTMTFLGHFNNFLELRYTANFGLLLAVGIIKFFLKELVDKGVRNEKTTFYNWTFNSKSDARRQHETKTTSLSFSG